MIRAVVFLGPSLSRARAERILDAVYLPPVAQGDLSSALLRYRPAIIGVVDGVFHQSLSLWHKEVLHALDQGVAVFGASSMGALRAAELSRFGMIGVGAVFRGYAAGVLEDDDEVAVAHGQAADGYALLSEPMVNFRATVERAVAEGALDEATGEALVRTAKSMHYAERTVRAVLRRAEQDGLDPGRIEAAREAFRARYVDRKAEDAEEMLRRIRDLPQRLRRQPRSEPIVRSLQLEALLQRDGRTAGGCRSAAVVQHAALTLDDFEHLNTSALQRALCLHLADLMEVVADDRDVERETECLRRRLGLATAEALSAWQERNDLTPAAFEELMRDEARCRSLRRWWLTASHKKRNVKAFLDQLRLLDRYDQQAEAAEQAEHRARAADAAYDSTCEGQPPLEGLLREHLAGSNLRIHQDVSDWLHEAGFLSWDNLAMSLLRARLGCSQEPPAANPGPGSPAAPSGEPPVA